MGWDKYIGVTMFGKYNLAQGLRAGTWAYSTQDLSHADFSCSIFYIWVINQLRFTLVWTNGIPVFVTQEQPNNSSCYITCYSIF